MGRSREEMKKLNRGRKLLFFLDFENYNGKRGNDMTSEYVLH